MSLNTWAKGNLGGSMEIGSHGSETSGGGTSDLTTATITSVVTTDDDTFFVDFYISGIDEENSQATCDFLTESGTTEIEAILYKGAAKLLLGYEPKSVSGNIEGTGMEYTVTGDCTLTFEYSGDGPT